MNVPNQKQRSVPKHDFGINPNMGAPRSVFPMDHAVKQAFNFSDLVPVLVEEVLPGDLWRCQIQTAARTAVPIVPIMDNWHLEFFTFFVPLRLVWANAPKFWGEQDNPADSISYVIPFMDGPVAGWPIGSIGDYMGCGTVGQITAGLQQRHIATPFRAYNLIWNKWFRDENLQNSVSAPTNDGPDGTAIYNLLVRGKRFDYFTQALPWPQKGGTAVTLPLGTTAPVKPNSTDLVTGVQSPTTLRVASTGALSASTFGGVNASGQWSNGSGGTGTWSPTAALYPSNLYADLSTATAATVNQLRQAITLQQYLEKDARGGTRYTEFVFNHFGVKSPDARLQNPEFIGGGHADIITSAIPQTSATGATGTTTPAGNLAASGYANGRTGFTYASTEHGYILTLVSARADLTYQQGLRRMWSRSTRYDFPVPLLANLGEQTVLNKEIFSNAGPNDNNVFGYVPRWDEYRHIPSRIAGIYRSTAAGTLDYWHSSQKFAALPTLNASWIQDDAKTTVQRNFAAGATSLGQQILADFYFSCTVTRALPAYGVPGLTRF